MLRIRVPIWSGLTRLQRLLLAAVTVVVVLFVLSTGLGARHGDGGGGLAEPPGFVQWMGDLFGRSSRVDPADLGGDCPRASLTPQTSPAPEPSPAPAASQSSRPEPTSLAGTSDPGRDLRTVPGSCRLTVAPRDGELRQLTLHAFDAVRVEAPMPHRDGRAVKELAAGEEVTVSVDAEGAEISLSCTATSICSIELT